VTDTKLVIIATHAAPDKPAYRRDLLSCLAYPNDQLVSFLYRQKWIAPALLQPVESARRALLVYCEKADNGDGALGSAGYNYLPIRFASLVGLGPTALLNSPDDPYLTASFRLGNFIAIAPGGVVATLDATNKQIGACEFSPHKPPDSTKWVFEADDPDELEEAIDPVIPWVTLVERLAHTSPLEGCTFVRFTGINREGQPLPGTTPDVRPGTAKFVDAPVYQLSSGATYRVELDYFSGPDVAVPPSPKTSGAGAAIQLSPAIFRSVGQTRKAVVALRCRPTYSTDLSVLVLDHKGSEVGNAPRLEVVVAVNPAVFLRILPFVLVLGFAASSLAVTDFEESFRLLAGIAKLAGAMMVALGVWWGFRRLPGV